MNGPPLALADALATGRARWSGNVLHVNHDNGTIAGRLYRSADGQRWRAWTATDRHQCTATDREVIRGATFAAAVQAVLSAPAPA